MLDDILFYVPSVYNQFCIGLRKHSVTKSVHISKKEPACTCTSVIFENTFFTFFYFFYKKVIKSYKKSKKVFKKKVKKSYFLYFFVKKSKKSNKKKVKKA